MKSPKAAIDPLRIYRQAEGFRLAYLRLLQAEDPSLQQQLGPAMIVNSAFSAELFLKCLICLETGSVPRGHHLKKLFLDLRSSTRKQIEAIWDVHAETKITYYAQLEAFLGKTISLNLINALTDGNQVFEQMRYIYESDGNYSFRITDLPNLLRTVILERRPEWEAPPAPPQPLSTFRNR